MAKTPSAWHDDARRRGGDHDDMQEQVYDWFRERLDQFEPWLGGVRRFVAGEVAVEYPLRREDDSGDIEAFADIALIYVWEGIDRLGSNRTLARSDFFYVFYELKPEIGTVGGVIRQCTAMEHIAKRCGYQCSVFPLVYADDPKLRALERFSPYPVCAIGRDIMKATEDQS